MGGIDGDPIEQLRVAMAELRMATARRRLLPPFSQDYVDAVSEETRINDRIMEIAAECNQMPLPKPEAGTRSVARIQAELIACGEEFVKTPEGRSREALAAWIEALCDELIRARAIERRDGSP
jgi:hypothetical protein